MARARRAFGVAHARPAGPGVRGAARKRHVDARSGHGGAQRRAAPFLRRGAQAASRSAGDGPGTLEPAGQLPQATTVRRGDPTTRQHHAPGTFSHGRRALPAGPAEPTVNGTLGARLQAAYAQPRPDGQAWTARSLAEAAGCGRSSAASFLQRQRLFAVEQTQ